jgi:hypothetical protein
VDVGDVADVSEVHDASVFKIEVVGVSKFMSVYIGLRFDKTMVEG